MVMVSDCGDRGLFAICTCSFRLKFVFLFPLVTAKLVGDYFDVELYGARGFFLFGPRLFSRYEDSVRNKITRYK